MYLMFAAVKYLAALRPQTRPYTTQSNRELPPNRLAMDTSCSFATTVETSNDHI